MNHEMKHFTDDLKAVLSDYHGETGQGTRTRPDHFIDAIEQIVSRFCEGRDDIDPDRYEVMELALGACNTLLRTIGIDFYQVLSAMVLDRDYPPGGEHIIERQRAWAEQRRVVKNRFYGVLRQAEVAGR